MAMVVLFRWQVSAKRFHFASKFWWESVCTLFWTSSLFLLWHSAAELRLASGCTVTDVQLQNVGSVRTNQFLPEKAPNPPNFSMYLVTVFGNLATVSRNLVTVCRNLATVCRNLVNVFRNRK